MKVFEALLATWATEKWMNQVQTESNQKDLFLINNQKIKIDEALEGINFI